MKTLYPPASGCRPPAFTYRQHRLWFGFSMTCLRMLRPPTTSTRKYRVTVWRGPYPVLRVRVGPQMIARRPGP